MPSVSAWSRATASAPESVLIALAAQGDTAAFEVIMRRHNQLPEVFRTVFVPRAVEEMDVDEIATALGIAPATVRTRFFRARGLLREGLASEIDVTPGDAFSFDGAPCDRIVAGVLARRAPADGLAAG